MNIDIDTGKGTGSFLEMAWYWILTNSSFNLASFTGVRLHNRLATYPCLDSHPSSLDRTHIDQIQEHW